MSNTQTNKKNIDAYFEFVNRKLQLIDNIDDPTEEQELKKPLYFSLLDFLSKSVSEGGNRERFTSFVRDYCEWPDQDRVSLPELEKALNYFLPNIEKKWASLRDYLNKRLIGFHNTNRICPVSEVDPFLKKISYFWPPNTKVDYDKSL